MGNAMARRLRSIGTAGAVAAACLCGAGAAKASSGLSFQIAKPERIDRLAPAPATAASVRLSDSIVPEADGRGSALLLGLGSRAALQDDGSVSQEPAASLTLEAARAQPVSLFGMAAARARMVRPQASDEPSISFGARLGLEASSEDTGLGFDIGLEPQARLVLDGAGRSAGAGARVRIGQFVERFANDRPDSWFLFAGADGQQLTWNVADDRRFSAAGVGYGDQATVGDMQAGIAIERFGGQLSLSYIQREVSYKEANRTEQFGGLTFSINR
jgi:hypothetical protein